jgi:hypothetical protein
VRRSKHGLLPWLRLLCANALLLAAGTAGAQSLEGVLMPGPVIDGHAKVEGECRKCHVPFDRAAQDMLCRDCHKEVDADLRARRGYHGRISPQACRSCHTDHKGRGAQIVKLDERSFDHKLTDFPLQGAHASPTLKCASCHQPRLKHREAPGTCNGCHRKDDVHKGRLGENCSQCHTDVKWKDVKFDHDKTRFALRHKHDGLKCAACHKDNAYKDTPLACVACHRKDDSHKTRYGEKCETCHDDRGWKPSTFNHDTDTRYALRGKHRTAKCESCHTGFLYKEKLASDCFACHQKDDKHQGSLGRKCGDCHVEQNWTVPRFDHDKTRFPLRGKHADIKCESCHKSKVFKEVSMTCFGCHQKDDKHKGRFGEGCGDCHTERNWKESRFDHDRTRFPLLGKHRPAKCESCHQDSNFKKTPSDCLSCHKKDDKHEGTLGAMCADCHNEKGWKDNVRFDHGRTRFPLVGRHIGVDCAKCHPTTRYKEVKTQCVDCHAREDVHQRRLGPRCADCHNARDWKLWDFNHDRRTKFVLDGKHRPLRCESCHTRPASDKPSLPMTCVSCHRGDDTHDGAYGPLCERCHVTSSFKQIKRQAGARPSVPDVTGPTRVAGVPRDGDWLLGERVPARRAMH